MKLQKIIAILLFGLGWLGAGENHYTPKQIDDLLLRVDGIRGPQKKSFVMMIEVKSVRNEKLLQVVRLQSYVDVETTPQNWSTLIRFIAPANRKGRFLLSSDNKMWFYKKGTRRAIRISPSQRLIGESSNADVSGMNYREYYRVLRYDLEKQGKLEMIKIELEKKKSGAPYHQIYLWIHEKNKYPVKANFFAKSGKKIKTLYYSKFKQFANIKGKQKRVSQMIIIDELKKNQITYIDIQDIQYKSLNANYFKESFLPQIRF